jgi:hypothetical protein
MRDPLRAALFAPSAVARGSAGRQRSEPCCAVPPNGARTLSCGDGATEGGGVGLFTINFELGDKTLQMLNAISTTSVIRVELGPETRAMVERLAAPDDAGGGPVAGLVKKGAQALRSDP